VEERALSRNISIEVADFDTVFGDDRKAHIRMVVRIRANLELAGHRHTRPQGIRRGQTGNE
jgi:hypothetical protein